MFTDYNYYLHIHSKQILPILNLLQIAPLDGIMTQDGMINLKVKDGMKNGRIWMDKTNLK